jgi:hypothetical protein
MEKDYHAHKGKPNLHHDPTTQKDHDKYDHIYQIDQDTKYMKKKGSRGLLGDKKRSKLEQ